jgi:hypothetical protein
MNEAFAMVGRGLVPRGVVCADRSEKETEKNDEDEDVALMGCNKG